jgi:nitrogen regulatory protein PII
MTKRELTILTDVSMITCVVQRGKADKVVQAAQDAGAQGATIYFGHGSGVRETLGLLELTVDMEKEIITTLVADDSVDRIFERMYFAGELDVPGGGIIYITKLDKMAMFIPHDVLARLSAEEGVSDTEASEPATSKSV